MSSLKKIKVNNVEYDIADSVSGFATTTYVDEHHDSTKVDVSTLSDYSTTSEMNSAISSAVSDMATKTWVTEYVDSIDGDDDYY